MIGEIAKRGYKKTHIANYLGINRNAFESKLRGKSCFLKDEFDKFHQTFFKDCSYEYLSEKQDIPKRIVV